MKTELNGKLGAAWGAFNNLARVWKHTTLNTSKKIHIFHAVIITRLLYGLSSAWLNARETRRLNGFYCRCLRVILKIPAAYFRVYQMLLFCRGLSKWSSHDNC